MKAKAGEKTLLASVLLSLPGPLVVGTALFYGRSSTQLADFIRRTAELGAIIVSWLVYGRLQKNRDRDGSYKERLERLAGLSVGAAMCLSGVALMLIAVVSPNVEKGNVVPGLIIAVLGVTTNSWFWVRYHKLNRQHPDAILGAQSKLYLAKSLVDACVTIALTFVALAPEAPMTHFVDLFGSFIVSLYLLINGIIMAVKTLKNTSVV